MFLGSRSAGHATPTLLASGAAGYEAWGRTIVGCPAVFDCWLTTPDSDLARWLDDALLVLSTGLAG
ncbi:hypothetical protein AB0E04_47485 [Streptomyces sp. NPDC048251]|uniref:hypothetical protein n=1 Tax=Streptomyces sp. NPDC048251 TaxID=3154501 RepID=UPI003441F417